MTSAWEWCKTRIATGFDRYVGRWTNVWFNVGLMFLFGGVALILDRNWARDIWLFSAGANFGYAFMWLTYPHFSKARQREMEMQMALMMAESFNKMTRETLESIARVVTEQDDEERPGRLQ